MLILLLLGFHGQHHPWTGFLLAILPMLLFFLLESAMSHPVFFVSAFLEALLDVFEAADVRDALALGEQAQAVLGGLEVRLEGALVSGFLEVVV